MKQANPWKKLLGKAKLCGSKHASRSRLKEVTITEETLQLQWEEQEGRCYWLGIPLDINDVFRSNYPLQPSIDRLNNDEDYHPDNIVICSSLANLGRGRCDAKTFQEIIRQLFYGQKDMSELWSATWAEKEGV